VSWRSRARLTQPVRTRATLGQPGGVRAIVPTGPCCWRATTIRVQRVGLRAGSWFPFWHSLGYPRVSTSVCIQCRIGRASPALPAECGGLSFPLSTTPGPLTHRNTDLPTATIGRKAPAAPPAGQSWRSPAAMPPTQTGPQIERTAPLCWRPTQASPAMRLTGMAIARDQLRLLTTPIPSRIM
jgi:hypothetical protein